jgi:hypothetical protein
MNQHRCLLVFLVAMHSPSICRAQALPQSFGELSGRLKSGDTVYVTQASGQSKGKVIEILPTALVLSIDGRRQDFNVATVNRVERERTAMKKGVLLGLLAGAGVAVACGISDSHCGLGNEAEGGAGIAAAALAGTGLAVGAGVATGAIWGARIKHRETVFAHSSASAPAALRFVPLLDRTRRGALVSVAF